MRVRGKSDGLENVESGGCDNRGYVEYETGCSAADCPGTFQAPGDPHREDWSDRAGICRVAALPAFLRGRIQGDRLRYRRQEGDRAGSRPVVYLPHSGGRDSGRAEEGLYGDDGVFAAVGAGRDYYVRAYAADGASRAGPELRGEYGEGCGSVGARRASWWCWRARRIRERRKS